MSENSIIDENQELAEQFLKTEEELKTPGTSRKSSFNQNQGFNLDNIISFDFGVLKTILVQLLNNQDQKDHFKADSKFRIDILKNRVDQLVVENDQKK